MDTCGDLLVLDTRVIVDPTVVDTIQKVEKLGQAMCDTFSKAVESHENGPYIIFYTIYYLSSVAN